MSAGDGLNESEASQAVRRHLAEKAPEFGRCASRARVAVGPFVGLIHAASGKGPTAVGVVLNQAANDFQDLLEDVESGRGRSALREARSLVELLVTALQMSGSATAAQRYLDHLVVSARTEAQLQIENQHLRGNERRADTHRRKKVLRDTETEEQRVLAKYGAGFRLSWTPARLADEAIRLGLEDEYRFYRLASSLLHGAVGGSMGTVSVGETATVHRLGPALTLCPLALLEGVTLFDRLVIVVGAPLRASAATKAFRAALKDLLSLWPDYRRAVLEYDRALWPERPPPGGAAVLAIVPATRKEEWFLYSAPTHEVFSAAPPTDIPPGVAGNLDEVRRRIYDQAPLSTERITVVVEGVDVKPIPGSGPLDPQLFFQEPLGANQEDRGPRPAV